MAENKRDPNTAFFNDAKWRSDFDQMLAATRDMAHMIAEYYHGLIADKVPRPVARQLACDLQRSIFGGRKDDV